MQEILAFNPYRMLYYSNRIEQIMEVEIPDPVFVSVFLTNKCAHKCIGCLYGEYRCKPEPDLPRKVALQLVDDLAGTGVKAIEFCGGGEQLQYPYFEEVAKRSINTNLTVGMITNGSLLTPRLTDLIIHGFGYVRVSLDAATPATYSKIHRVPPAVFNKVIRNVKLLVKRKRQLHSDITIGLKFLAYKYNAPEMERFVQLGESLGVDNLQFKPARQAGVHELSQHELDRLSKKLAQLKASSEVSIIGGFGKSKLLSPTCRACSLWSVIMPNGDVCLCCYVQGRETRHCFGNLNKKRFWDIWHSSAHKRALKAIRRAECNLFDCRFHKYNDIIDNLERHPADMHFL